MFGRLLFDVFEIKTKSVAAESVAFFHLLVRKSVKALRRVQFFRADVVGFDFETVPRCRIERGEHREKVFSRARAAVFGLNIKFVRPDAFSAGFTRIGKRHKRIARDLSVVYEKQTVGVGRAVYNLVEGLLVKVFGYRSKHCVGRIEVAAHGDKLGFVRGGHFAK